MINIIVAIIFVYTHTQHSKGLYMFFFIISENLITTLYISFSFFFYKEGLNIN